MMVTGKLGSFTPRSLPTRLELHVPSFFGVGLNTRNHTALAGKEQALACDGSLSDTLRRKVEVGESSVQSDTYMSDRQN